MVVKTAVRHSNSTQWILLDGSNIKMLGNLKAPPEPFSDIIGTHFRLKARSISVQLDEWLKLDDGKSTASDGAYSSGRAEGSASSNGFAKDVEELKQLLRELETS